ncbi:MAG: selU [Firmicutes bacterium]|nr:selU [Bacillota bacterium]
MCKVISIQDSLKLPNRLFIDVRTPKEFAEGHLPGALNIPIFSNDERATVGTLYKQVSVDAAKQLGVEIASPKLPAIIKSLTTYANQNYQIVIYCWRGGMRSKSIVNILDMLDIAAFQLAGGYKSYRRHVLDHLEAFDLKPQALVLYGATGVGKTTILNKLALQGIPTIDLEKLANHRGSVFGQIGLGNSTTMPLFESQILDHLEKLQTQPYFFVECESNRIGNVYIPKVLYQRMLSGKKILIHASVPTRVQRLIAEYSNNASIDKAEIQRSIQAISKNLGKKKTAFLLECLTNNHIEKLVTTLLTDYYDLLYGFENPKDIQYDAIISAENLDQATAELVALVQKL